MTRLCTCLPRWCILGNVSDHGEPQPNVDNLWRTHWATMANWPNAKRARTSSLFHTDTPPWAISGNWPRVAKPLGKTANHWVLAALVAQGVGSAISWHTAKRPLNPGHGANKGNPEAIMNGPIPPPVIHTIQGYTSRACSQNHSSSWANPDLLIHSETSLSHK